MPDRFRFQSGKYKEGALRVLHFRGVESISQLFRYEVELTGDSSEVDLDAIVGQPALLKISAQQSHRVIHGIIEVFEQLGSIGAEDTVHYRATIVPTIAPLGLCLNARVFQELSTLEIVKQVLQQAKLPSDCIRLSVRESDYKKRDFCVQYQESDLQFICRLLEEEGIAFFFEHTDRQDVLVLFDDPKALTALPRAETLLYCKHHDEALDEEGITELTQSSALYAGSALMRDFRFVHPDLGDMEVSASAAAFTQYQRYYYPGEYVDPQLGSRLVRIRMQEQEWHRHVFSGRANAAALATGYKFRLKEHPQSARNQEYLVISFVVTGGNDRRETKSSFAIEKLCCIPAKVPFRPDRVTPQPRIPGVQTAIVVGPQGEEIHCDQYGRIRVRFHWDRRTDRKGDSSCWIRVSQPWAGNAYGGMFLPRVGHEVVVQFIDGDPDRPVVVGRLYNGDNPVPYGLPEAKTRSTLRSSSSPKADGFNEIRFEDEAQKEELYVHGQRNFKKEILKDSDTKIGGDHTEAIDGNSTYKIKKDWTIDVDGNRGTTIGGNDELTVKKDQRTTVEGNRDTTIHGNDQLTVSKDQTISIEGNLHETVGKKLTQEVRSDISQSTDAGLTIHAAKNISITADGDVTIAGRNITLRGEQKVTIVVGDSTITLSSSGITIDAAKVKINGQSGTTVN